MATYYVDDGGDNSTGASWAAAYTSIASLDTAVTIASGDIIYVGHDSVALQGSALTVTGPASGAPCYLISATQGSSPVTYAKSSTDQMGTTGNFAVTFNGSWAMYGVRIVSGGTSTTALTLAPDTDTTFYMDDCTLASGAGGGMAIGVAGSKLSAKNLTIDLTADGTTNRTADVISSVSGTVTINGLTFVNPAYRTARVIGTGTNITALRISGADFSGFTNATTCEILNTSEYGEVIFSNCKTKASPTLVQITGGTRPGLGAFFYNVGNADDPARFYATTYFGTLDSSTSIYRTSGATFETVASSLLVTTTAVCAEGSPLATPWMYGTISSTGSKTFDVYIVNDTGDFTDAEVWLEVEYTGTSGSPLMTFTSDHRSTILTTAAAQTDDVTSTWNGSGPTFTYMQKLSVTATVNETGQYRARVVVGKASITSASNFYIDPCVTVS